MGIVYRAEDEPPRSRLDYWRQVVRDTFVPFDVRIHAGSDFRSQIRGGDLGSVRVSEVTAPPCELSRTPRYIRGPDPELYKIQIQARGRLVVEQDGREARLAPGDLTILDMARPWHLAGPAHRCVTLLFPRSLVPLRPEEVAMLTGHRVSGSRGVGALVSSLALRLPRHLDDEADRAGARLGTAVVDLLTIALADRLDRRREVPSEVGRRALLIRVHTFIERRLADPGLTPATIAAAHHISLRYLHKLFESDGKTVAGWIRRRRLDRCRRDLLDPAFRDTTVRVIGARWGFVEPTTFNRVFRTTYGIAPGEYRAAHNGSRG